MRMIRGLGGTPEGTGPTVVTMGNFDGVHRGHRVILEQVVETAESQGMSSCLVTFFPHPLKVLHPERAPSMIQSLEDRQNEIEKAGLDFLEVIPFTFELAAISADDFIRDHLIGRLKCRELFVGEDARFGRGREGDVELLTRYSKRGEFKLHVMPAVEIDGMRISSSRIRRRIEEGDMETAERMIGRPFSVCGEVVHGEGRGAKLGFPTANILFDGETRPRHGVYACGGPSWTHTYVRVQASRDGGPSAGIRWGPGGHEGPAELL
ncbi:MAG: riboflavin biosynthesis protein RibF [Deltaproteobacteria bacterium]|nr:riboflavin biosynthesis protein RibF [Deltaproteobacteria bacterium]